MNSRELQRGMALVRSIEAIDSWIETFAENKSPFVRIDLQFFSANERSSQAYDVDDSLVPAGLMLEGLKYMRRVAIAGLEELGIELAEPAVEQPAGPEAEEQPL